VSKKNSPNNKKKIYMYFTTSINSGDYTVLLVHNEIMIVLVSIPPCPKVFRKYCVKKKCPNNKKNSPNNKKKIYMYFTLQTFGN
jgi:hypothetical protein